MLKNINVNSNHSIADYGAQKVLNMGGSLLGYINTGNPYDSRYFNKKEQKSDIFEKKTDKKTNKTPLIVGMIAGIKAAFLGILLYTKKIKLPKLTAITSGLKAIPSKIKTLIKIKK